MEFGDLPEDNRLDELFSESEYEAFFNELKKLSPEKKLKAINSLFEDYGFDDKDNTVFLTQLFDALKKEDLIAKLPLYLEQEAMTDMLDILNNHHLTQIAIDIIHYLSKDADKLSEYLSEEILKNEDIAFAAFNHVQFKKGRKIGGNNEFFEPYEETIHKIFSDDELFKQNKSKLSTLKINPESILYLVSIDNSNEPFATKVLNNYDKYLESNLDMLEEFKQILFIKSKNTYYFNKASYRELLCSLVPLMNVTENDNSTLFKNGLNNDFLLSKLRETAFHNIDKMNFEEKNNVGYYKTIFSKIINNPSYNEELAKIDFQIMMNLCPDNSVEEHKKTKITTYYTKNDFALYCATELAKKYEAISHTNYEGHNALTLYVEKIAQISANNKKINANPNVSSDLEKAQEPLDVELLKVFYQNNPKLLLQANSFGKYPWNYLNNEIITNYAKFNDSNSIVGPLHQFEIFLESINMLNAYKKIKEFEQDDVILEEKIEPAKKLSFFNRLLKSFSLKEDKEKTIENKVIEPIKEDNLTTFNQKLEQSKNLLNNEIIDKISNILTLSTDIYTLIKDEKTAIEANILIKNTLKNYLPTIIDNFIALNELKSNDEDTQATKITLEQLNVLEEKFMHVKEETNQIKKANVMADVESFGSFLNNKTQKVMKM